MERSIDIDDEVYAWLKSQADPFEDTPNSVLRRIAGLASGGPVAVAIPSASQPTALPPPSQQVARMGTGRPKMNAQALLSLGVSHFVVDNHIPDYLGKRAHPRAYLDTMLNSGKTTVPYFERWTEEGRPNPRGDAASRVILKVGLHDNESSVCFHDGRQVTMSRFVGDFLG